MFGDDTVDSALASCSPVPWKPVSELPTESVKIAFGNARIQRSLTALLKIFTRLGFTFLALQNDSLRRARS